MMGQKQILIVEDNGLNRELLVEILSGQYSVLEAENGRQALDIMRQRQEEIALILLDVMMPVMDGYAFLDRVKADPELSLIPVIVMTQSSSEADEVAALAHGATDFVPKPYRPQVILHRVASIINLRETAAMINQLQYDRLTGLYSKEFFYRKAQELLIGHPDTEYVAICSNIVNFKLYNDLFGAAGGDRLLCRIAGLYREIIDGRGVCGRLSSDRFLILCERNPDSGEATLREIIRRINSLTEISCHVDVRWGIYLIGDRAIPVEQMCDRAMLAVDSIKSRYDQFFAIYDDALRSRLLREQAITDAMETALAEEQFTVYLQPKHSLSEERMSGAEALVRWVHPKWGFLSPGEFIPLFEKNGFITRLDRFVWERVCRLLHDWQAQGIECVPVSVNVSRADVYQADLPAVLAGLTQKYGVDPALLHLEITESAYTEDPDQLLHTVDRLRALGFPVEMDDFGSGYSSLNLLNQMKLDVLKLDMKFVQSETAKPEKESILRFVMSMARLLRLRVVAEGVETVGQLERLRALGCDDVQGYFIAKPMPSAEFEALLRHRPAFDPVTPCPAQKATDAPCILIVDNDAAYRQTVQTAFCESRYQVIEAADADEARTLLAARRDVISAVVLSLTLPGGSGLPLLKYLRTPEMAPYIPTLVIAPPDEQLEELALELGADEFACKLHPGRSLQRRVERLIRLAACQERERILQDAACRDELTGLLNRRGLRMELDAVQQEDLPAAVYLFDLDDLKPVNDRYGHEAGDQMLQAFAALLRLQTRNGDVLCRYGGDEFAVVLKGMRSATAAQKKGEDICREFSSQPLDCGLTPACSAGVTLWCAGETFTQGLIERADRALYQAKREQKGCCCPEDA